MSAAFPDITSPAQGRKPRTRYVPPERPEGGYHVTSNEQPVWSWLGDADHKTAIIDALEQIELIDDRMVVIERKIETLLRKLYDPSLMVEYGEDHPVRLEAEERLSSLLRLLNDERLTVSQVASDIHAHGDYLQRSGHHDELDAIGRTLQRDSGPLGSVQRDVDGLMTGSTWIRLYRAACPF